MSQGVSQADLEQRLIGSEPAALRVGDAMRLLVLVLLRHDPRVQAAYDVWLARCVQHEEAGDFTDGTRVLKIVKRANSRAALAAFEAAWPPTSPHPFNRLQWTRELIVNSRLFFATPVSFNDPIDCRIHPSFDGSELIIKNHWNAAVALEYPEMPGHIRRREVKRMLRESRTADGKRALQQKAMASVASCGIACFTT